MSRAMSRAPSWMLRGTLRAGPLGQQRGFNVQAWQSDLQELVVVHDRSRGGQPLAARAAIDVGFVVVGKVGAREGVVGPLRFVEDRDMRLDATFVHQPIEHLRGAVGRVAGQTLRVRPSRSSTRSII